MEAEVVNEHLFSRRPWLAEDSCNLVDAKMFQRPASVKACSGIGASYRPKSNTLSSLSRAETGCWNIRNGVRSLAQVCIPS